MIKQNLMQWIKCASVRALKTMAQTAMAVIGTTSVMYDVNWNTVLATTLLAGILSILTSLAGLPEVESEK